MAMSIFEEIVQAADSSSARWAETGSAPLARLAPNAAGIGPKWTPELPVDLPDAPGRIAYRRPRDLTARLSKFDVAAGD